MERSESRVQSLPGVPGVKAQDLKIFMRQGEVEMSTKALWCLILTWADRDGGNAFPKIETLSEISGWDLKTVKKHLAILRDAGFLEIRKEKRKGARYFHNVYRLKPRGKKRTPYGTQNLGHYQVPYTRTDNLSVESEAILRALPDPLDGEIRAIQ